MSPRVIATRSIPSGASYSFRLEPLGLILHPEPRAGVLSSSAVRSRTGLAAIGARLSALGLSDPSGAIELAAGPFFLTDFNDHEIGTPPPAPYLTVYVSVPDTTSCDDVHAFTTGGLPAGAEVIVQHVSQAEPTSGARYFIPAGRRLCGELRAVGLISWAGFRPYD